MSNTPLTDFPNPNLASGRAGVAAPSLGAAGGARALASGRPVAPASASASAPASASASASASATASPAPAASGGPRTVAFKSNGLTAECAYGPTGRLQRKTERWPGGGAEYRYAADQRGRVCKVWRDGRLVEEYAYNPAGQRIWQRREYDAPEGIHGLPGAAPLVALDYDPQGRLVRAGDTVFAYDRKGALAARRNAQGLTRFQYGEDTILDRAVLPSGQEIRYEYGSESPICPARRFKNGVLATAYRWRDMLWLSHCLDYERGLAYAFEYDQRKALHKVRVEAMAPEEWAREALREGPAHHEERDWVAESASWLEASAARTRNDRLHELLTRHGGCFELWVGCDQAGTPKVLEHFTLEMLCKDLSSNPCSEIVVGGLCLPLNDYLKRKML